MSSIRWQQNNPNIYLLVNSRWYRYDTSFPPVGEGAMGIVYLGFDCQTNEKVAIKMLRKEFWNNISIRNRLKLEASIRIDHPNIIRMIGFCEEGTETGPLYVLSEYVCGVTFKEHVQNQLGHTGSAERNKKIVSEFMPILYAVSHLHSLGIIHRDIKPMNIMLQDGYRIKLMDLGIAKADCFFDAHLKGFIGSKPYAAPEQVVPDNVEAKIDHRADIYALGVTLANLLTDHFPVCKGDNLPDTITSIIDRATAINPADRYSKCDDMGYDLNVYLAEQPKKKVNSGLIVTIVALAIMMVAVLAYVWTYILY